MILQYLETAMSHHAQYEILDDDKSFYGKIPGFDGLWANASTLEDCRRELLEALKDWLLISLRLNKSIPAIDNLTLEVRKVA